MSYTIKGPGEISVFIPDPPPPEADNEIRDLPPGDPPEVLYGGVRANYWNVLREGKMPYLHGEKVFKAAEMDWLRDVEIEVETLLRG